MDQLQKCNIVLSTIRNSNSVIQIEWWVAIDGWKMFGNILAESRSEEGCGSARLGCNRSLAGIIWGMMDREFYSVEWV